MRGKLLSVIVFFFVLACSEEDLPGGIYHYQVERLLSGESGTKVWSEVVNSSDCADSVKLYFELVNDSIDISQINPGATCVFLDTIYLGRANASKFSESDLFTDSLIFSNGDFWIVKGITSKMLSIFRDESKIDYLAD
ncbi:hypothetical protein SAMN05421640_2963 [Ekhidna lutea]|uniref:Lipoprotein n=1 Tax=Ekhidna lutea TaxID=447679 RepID=A0A239L6U5_EKHLU|nr:hypothetical protein [Ekhidna lutea]SNT25244.1 hypothetical protein SAMN05421640_2963 [Ekhidna lutea]